MIFRVVVLSSSLALGMTASAAQCGAPGSGGVFRTLDGSGVLLYAYRERNDWQWVVPGTDFALDEGAPEGDVRFTLDGTYYQVAFNDVHTVGPLVAPLAPDHPLRRHASWELAYMREQGAPLDAVEDLGIRPKPATGGTPQLEFLLLRLTGKKLPGVVQYFLMTQLDGEFLTIVAATATSTEEKRVRESLESIAGSLVHVPIGECPQG